MLTNESLLAPPDTDAGSSARRDITAGNTERLRRSEQLRSPYAAIGARCSAYFTAYAIVDGRSPGGPPRMTAYDQSGWKVPRPWLTIVSTSQRRIAGDGSAAPSVARDRSRKSMRK